MPKESRMSIQAPLIRADNDCPYIGQRVDVYFNLNKHVFSIRVKGIVVLHTAHLVLRDVTFVVSEIGRQKVIRNRKKNVHAYARGTLVSLDLPLIHTNTREITYLPYEHNQFFYADTYSDKQDVTSSKLVQCLNKKLYEPRS